MINKTHLLALCVSMFSICANAQDCNRACLEEWVDRYFDAVIENEV